MRFDLHGRAGLAERLAALATRMGTWESGPRLSQDEAGRIRSAIQVFRHTTERDVLRLGGVDGSGDFPALSYGDSLVYVTTAQGTVYEASHVAGLREIPFGDQRLPEFTWIPEDDDQRREQLDSAFASMAGMPVREVVQQSDYRTLREAETHRPQSVDELVTGLIRPHAADTGNLAVQLRSTAEMGAALSILSHDQAPDYVLVDTTLSLPFVHRADASLFYEHLKRLCCVQARKKGVAFLALSKSHGLPGMQLVETLARDVAGHPEHRVAEHWYLRIPTQPIDGWTLSLAEGRRLPPAGSVSYLVRFHRTTPVLRLDMDAAYWAAGIRAASERETRERERRLFEDLDFASHDQRCYGYPYPIKAAHDRVSLTQAERVALRKLMVDAAVGAGMSRSLFRDASIETGHE